MPCQFAKTGSDYTPALGTINFTPNKSLKAIARLGWLSTLVACLAFRMMTTPGLISG